MALRLVFNYGRPHNLSPQGGYARARGGIVSALVDLTQALAAQGHEVHVFAPLHQPTELGGVQFHRRSDLAAFTTSSPPDVLVCIPELLALLLPAPARARVVWSGNAHSGGDCALAAPWDWAPQLGARGQRARLYPIGMLQRYADRIAVKSDWQAEYVATTQGIPARAFVTLYNGIPLRLFEGPAPPRQDRRLIYTSQARRGLDGLLRLLPAIQAQVPGTELHVFGYEYQREEYQRTGPQGVPGAEPVGVVWRGTVGKADLARELRSATLMTYPTAFKETFCTSVAEGQAAGLPVVASSKAALVERVADGVDGFLVGGRPGDAAHDDAFVAAVVTILTDRVLRERMGAAARAKACAQYGWDQIAVRWSGLLAELAGKPVGLPPVDPALDLLDPALLHVADSGVEAEIPAERAAAWLREEWASYGFDPAGVPGLR